MSSPFSIISEIGTEPKDSVDVNESFGVLSDSPEPTPQVATDEVSTTITHDVSAEPSLSASSSKSSLVPSHVVDETLASITALTNASILAGPSADAPVEHDPFAAPSSSHSASPLVTQVPPASKPRASPLAASEDQIPAAKAPRVLVIFHGEESGPGTSETPL